MASSPNTPVIRKHNSLLDLAGNTAINIEHNGEDLYELIKTQHEHGYEPKNHPDFLVRFFYKWGYTVGKYPKVTIALCTLFMLIFGAGALMVESEPDFMELFLDRDGEDYKNYKYLVDTFGFKGGYTSSSYIFVKGKGDLLTPEGMRALVELKEQYSIGIGAKWETVTPKYEFNDEYESPFGVARLYNSSYVPNTKAEILADLNTSPSAKTWNGEYVQDPLVYQYTKDTNGDWATAKIAIIGVTYKTGIHGFDKEGEDYEKALNDAVGTKPSYIEDVYVANTYQANEDSKQMNAQMTFGVVVASFLICIYCLTTMRIGQVHGRSEMMIASLISVGYASVSAYGFMGYLGITWNTMNSMAIILMIGISFDDCFILTWDYHQQYLWGLHLLEENEDKSINEVYPVEERIGNTMAAGGYSVFITSFTDLIVFSIAAAMSPIPMLQSFSLFCGVGVFLDFLYQTTIFLAILHFSAKRQESGLMDCCCCCSKPEDVNARDCGKEPLNPFVNNSIYDKFFGQYLPNLVLSRIGMFVVLLLWLVFLVIGIVGMTKVETEWDQTSFNLEGTDGYEIAAIQSDPDEPASNNPNTIFFKSDDFEQFKDNMDNVLAALQSDTKHFSTTAYVWYDYKSWLNSNGQQFPATHAAFSTSMKDYVTSADGFALSGDVSFDDEAQTDVGAMQGVTLESGRFEYNVMLENYRELKKVVESQNEGSFKGFRFGMWGALNEMNEDTLPNCLLSLYVAVPVIALIVAGNLRHLQATCYVFLMIVSIDIEVIGISAFAGIKFDFFFALAILLALGVTVDFNIHVAHRSLELLENDSIESAYERNVDHTRKVYMSVGSSVFHGTFSTLLVCLVPMIFIGIKAFRQFFGMLCMIMVFGMFHGLIILPVIMTVFPITHEHTARAVTIRRESQMGGDLKAFQTSDAMKDALATKADSDSEDEAGKRSPRDDIELQAKASE